MGSYVAITSTRPYSSLSLFSQAISLFPFPFFLVPCLFTSYMHVGNINCLSIILNADCNGQSPVTLIIMLAQLLILCQNVRLYVAWLCKLRGMLTFTPLSVLVCSWVCAGPVWLTCLDASTTGMSQQADGGFGGPGTPQSPLLSPRMAHTQSPMMQQGQGNAAFQGSPDMNGWPQGNMGGNR